ncbi:MAG TPA: nitrite/sulfite reductase [Alphaproteobacteria bacterium]|nr:nitrite/sulfite reductase [Alphaproteobacteria bacterium]
MYRYDQFDQRLVDERVAQFRDQVRRRIAGELSDEEFKPLRLMNGVYLQLHSYMLRVAIPYGVLSALQLRKLAHLARTYDRGYGHFTTRQNIQFHWVRLEETPDILAELAEVEMHAIQTSGNSLRNTTADQYAGVAADEIADPRVYAEIIRQWATLHPEFSFLPRKFKIAVTGGARDRAAVKTHDIGLFIRRNAAGELGFEVVVGGGQGRTPFLAKTLRKFLPEADLLSYIEAILRVYNEFGRRDNIYKARIKILVHELGIEKFAELVEAEWAATRAGALRLPEAELARIRAHFASPPYEEIAPPGASLEAERRADPAFARWLRHNTAAHVKPGYAIANISLKATGAVPGDISAGQMEALADLAERLSFGEIRVTHEQNLTLPYVKASELYTLWQALGTLGLATPNIGLASDIIACPGLDFCSLANARSIPIAQRIAERLKDVERQEAIGELRIKISGCINACGHHHVGHIGLLGVDKQGEEFYQMTLGGHAEEDASLGTIIGPAFSSADVVDAVERVVETYLGLRAPGERFIDAYRRVGAQPFKDKLYAAH